MLDDLRRSYLGTLLGVALAVVAFPFGVVVGGIYFVPAGSGLAGPTVALSYGLIAVVVTSVFSGLLAMYLERRLLLIAVYMAIGGASVALIGVGVRLLQLREQEQLVMTAQPALAPFRFSMQVADDVPNRAFQSIEIDTVRRSMKVVSLEDDRSCRSPLTVEQHGALLEVLRPVDELLSQRTDRCPSIRAVDYTLEWSFASDTAPRPPVRIEVDVECVRSRLALGKLVGAANRLWLAAHRSRCR